jgi:predicted  nucleic acid-binding Zn-ribbon protein
MEVQHSETDVQGDTKKRWGLLGTPTSIYLIRFIYYIYNYRLLYYLPMERMEKKEKKSEREIDLEQTIDTLKKRMSEYEFEYDKKQKQVKFLEEENKKLKERIDVLYEFIERNDKLVDEVIDEEDLDKLNRYIYIDDDLVDRTLESE